ncbi:MAG: hypothetical protein QOH62_3874 [Solirubrobacteraceae bacterium]|jgi:hypothetical protein|nr:hypothetical protein [Solirubrobacteraceae bacterium]
MGFFKDIKNLQDTAKEMTPPEHRGVLGGFRAMKDGVAQANQVLGGIANEGQKAQQLMQSGRVGSATISAVRQTGTFVNNNPECEIDLQVSVDGGAPYAVTHRQVLAMVALPSFQPGASVPVRVDPGDANSLIIA